MKNKFMVEPIRFSTIREIDGDRSHADYVALLREMDFDETDGMGLEEVIEMCLMSLQDLEPAEAAAVVLTHDMGDALNSGQIKNCSVEMLDEKLWEEYASIALHRRMFRAGALLYRAFPSSFPKPDAVLVSVKVTAENDAAREALHEPLTPAFVLRLLADGMGDRAIIRRLFDDQLAGEPFAEAEHIVWTFSTESHDGTVTITAVSSGSFFDPLEDIGSYHSSAHADE